MKGPAAKRRGDAEQFLLIRRSRAGAKVPDVLFLPARGRKISSGTPTTAVWGLGDRHLRHWWEYYQEFGYRWVFELQCDRPSLGITEAGSEAA